MVFFVIGSQLDIRNLPTFSNIVVSSILYCLGRYSYGTPVFFLIVSDESTHNEKSLYLMDSSYVVDCPGNPSGEKLRRSDP